MGGTFVISDVHGHLDDLRAVLHEAGLVDGDGRWSGQDAQLWILGDLVDRGPDGLGAVHFVRELQGQAPDQVHVLMGNHEALMLGVKLFPESRFGPVWQINGGHVVDQAGLTDDDVTWLRGLPVLGRAGEYLLMHSDTTGYLQWGKSIEEVNATVTSLLAEHDVQDHFAVFAALTSRYDFAHEDGTAQAREMLDILGGDCIVHGHSIIGSLIGVPSYEVKAPIMYADGLVVAIDGGRYDGGPLLLVHLE